MIQAVCWMLIHSLWEGGLCAVAAGLVLISTKRAASATRYGLLSGVFFLFLVLTGYTLYREWPREWLAWLSTEVPAQQRDDGSGFLNTSLVLVCGYLSDHAHLIVGAWMLICMYQCLRMTGGLFHLRRLRLESSLPPTGWIVRVEVLCAELGIRRMVELKESLRVSVPVVIGTLRPLILMPMGLLTGLPEGEIEAVLLHELAHIRRFDYSMNFLQRITEILFFFNPGLLWISGLLRDEREHCCDDLAISQTRDKVQFVRALVSFRELSMPSSAGARHRPELALAFPSGKGQLLQRVERIVYKKNKTLRPAEKLFLLGSCMALGFLLAMPGKMPVAAGNSHAYVTILGGSRAPILSGPVARANGRKEEGTVEALGRADLKEKDLLKEKLSMEIRIAEMNEMHAAEINVTGAAEINEIGAAERNETPTREEQDREMQALITDLQNVGSKVKKASDMELAEIETIRKKLEADRAQQDAAWISEEVERLQAEKDRKPAIPDREQAVADQHQAQEDRLQALRDRAQAELDRKEAEIGRKQAEEASRRVQLDKLQAELDRALTIENRRNAEIDRQHEIRAKVVVTEKNQVIHTNKD